MSGTNETKLSAGPTLSEANLPANAFVVLLSVVGGVLDNCKITCQDFKDWLGVPDAYVPPYREFSGTTVAPTIADNGGAIDSTGNAAVTATINNLAKGTSYTIRQRGTGQVTLVAGNGLTLRDGNVGAAASFKTKGQWGALTVFHDGAGNASVHGPMA